LIKLSSEDYVHKLREKVKSLKGNDLNRVDVDWLNVWRCKKLCIRDIRDRRKLKPSNIKSCIMAIDFSNNEDNNYIIEISFTEANLNIGKDETLLVQIPGMFRIFKCTLILKN
jgi:hypothetical protein